MEKLPREDSAFQRLQQSGLLGTTSASQSAETSSRSVTNVQNVEQPMSLEPVSQEDAQILVDAQSLLAKSADGSPCRYVIIQVGENEGEQQSYALAMEGDDIPTEGQTIIFNQEDGSQAVFEVPSSLNIVSSDGTETGSEATLSQELAVLPGNGATQAQPLQILQSAVEAVSGGNVVEEERKQLQFDRYPEEGRATEDAGRKVSAPADQPEDEDAESVRNESGQAAHFRQLSLIANIEEFLKSIVKCTDPCCGCKQFHCPLCPTDVFKPTVLSKLKRHIYAHWKIKVDFEAKGIVRCHHICHPHDSHFHCPCCSRIFTKRNTFIFHLNKEHSANIPESKMMEDEDTMRESTKMQITTPKTPTPRRRRIPQVYNMVMAVVAPDTLDYLGTQKLSILDECKEKTGVSYNLSNLNYCVLKGEMKAIHDSYWIIEDRLSEIYNNPDPIGFVIPEQKGTAEKRDVMAPLELDSDDTVSNRTPLHDQDLTRRGLDEHLEGEPESVGHVVDSNLSQGSEECHGLVLSVDDSSKIGKESFDVHPGVRPGDRVFAVVVDDEKCTEEAVTSLAQMLDSPNFLDKVQSVSSSSDSEKVVLPETSSALMEALVGTGRKALTVNTGQSGQISVSVLENSKIPETAKLLNLSDVLGPSENSSETCQSSVAIAADVKNSGHIATSNSSGTAEDGSSFEESPVRDTMPHLPEPKSSSPATGRTWNLRRKRTTYRDYQSRMDALVSPWTKKSAEQQELDEEEQEENAKDPGLPISVEIQTRSRKRALDDSDYLPPKVAKVNETPDFLVKRKRGRPRKTPIKAVTDIPLPNESVPESVDAEPVAEDAQVTSVHGNQAGASQLPEVEKCQSLFDEESMPCQDENQPIHRGPLTDLKRTMPKTPKTEHFDDPGTVSNGESTEESPSTALITSNFENQATEIPSKIIGAEPKTEKSNVELDVIHDDLTGDVKLSLSVSFPSTPKFGFNKKRPLPPSGKTYECALCHLIFLRRGDLSKHHFGVHKLKRAPRLKAVCDVCGKEMRQKHLKAHIAAIHKHEKPFQCSLCDKTFSTNSYLKYHLGTHRNTKERPRPHLCSVCGRGFYKISQLQDHLNSHSGSRPHQCKICGKSFPYRSAIHKHMTVHSQQKPYQCPVCRKAFKSKDYLRNHQMTHEPQSHPCENCHRVYSYRHTLLLHQKRCVGLDRGDLANHLNQDEHVPTQPQRYMCGYCQELFLDLETVQEHLTQHLQQEATTAEELMQTLAEAEIIETEDHEAAVQLEAGFIEQGVTGVENCFIEVSDTAVIIEDDNQVMVKAEPPSEIVHVDLVEDVLVAHEDQQQAALVATVEGSECTIQNVMGVPVVIQNPI